MRAFTLSLACVALGLGLAVASPVLAQSSSASTSTSTSTSVETTPAAKLNFTLDTPVEQIFANPRGKAVLDKIFPEMYTHPAYDQFKGLSLNQLIGIANGAITPEQLKAAEAELKKLDE